MFDGIVIENFRIFKKINLQNLKRVNLFVGKNNSGKTCILEAIELLCAPNPNTLIQGAIRRQEMSSVEVLPGTNPQYLPDLRFAFSGRGIITNSTIKIDGNQKESSTTLSIEAKEFNLQQQLQQLPQFHGMQPNTLFSSLGIELALSFNINNQLTAVLPLIHGSCAQIPPFIPPTITGASLFSRPTKFVCNSNVNTQYATNIWGQFAATEEEDRIIQALQIVEPEIEKISASPVPTPMLFARLKGAKERVPLGNLGDGVTRFLVFSGQISALETGGVLLLDEIDVGLHVSVMEKLWDLVLSISESRNIQVFATTHSDDCLRGLAACLAKRGGEDSVALHRVEREKGGRIISYNKQEIITSAQQGIEVR